MMQGDAYSVPVTITAQDGTVVTPDMVTCVEITIGNLSRKYPGAVTFDEDAGAWQFPLTQQQTFRLSQGKQETQARVVFASGDVFGGRGDTVFVTGSLSKGVLPQPEKETAGIVAPSISQVRLGSAGKIRATVGSAKVVLTSSLPPISETTKGQYLTNDGTEAKWGDVDALPAMSGDTAGKMLTNDGGKAEWGDVPKEVMVVNFTQGDDGDWSADKNWDEVAALIESGGLVYAVNDSDFLPLIGYLKAQDEVTFQLIQPTPFDIINHIFYWKQNGTIESFSSPLAVVKYRMQRLDADQQAQARTNIGLTPVAKTDEMTQSVGLDDETGELFTAPAEVFYIDLEGTYPDYTCSTAMADIAAAYVAGKELKCRCAIGGYTAMLPLFIPMPSANTWVFSGAGALKVMGFLAQTLTIAVTSNGVQASGTQLATMDAKLPNPYPLTITSGSTTVTYKGSEAKNIDIPTALPNPNALTIKVGDTTTTYDGSAAKTVEVEGGNNPLDITGAQVGQIAKITAVDAEGKPTAWEAVDMPTGVGETWEKLIDTSLAESVESVTYTFDDCKRIKALIAPVIASDEPVFGWKRFTINNVSYPSLNNTMRSYEGICLRIDSEYPPYVQANANTNTKLSVNGLVGGAYTAALENIAPNGITEFGCQTAEILKAGTKIEIWGVKS